MFNVSRAVLLVVGFFASVLLLTSLAFNFFPGWALAVIIGIYVAVAMINRRSGPVVQRSRQA
jgi:hypothetical protein